MDPAIRFAGQLLSGPRPRTVGGVVEHLLAVQGQEQRAFRLAVRSRSEGLRSSDVDAALAAGELCVSWLNRGTLHLVRTADHDRLHAVTTPQTRQANRRRLEQEGLSAAEAVRGVEVITRVLDEGPAGRPALRAALDAAGVRTAGQALVHVLIKASLEGLVVRGPVIEGEHCFVRRDVRPVDRDEALAWLGPRFVASRPDATDRDLAKWAGLTLRDARRALDGVERPDPAGPGSPLPPPTLLGPFDETLMSWVDRSWVLGDHDVVTSNGIFRPFVLIEGRCVGTWGLPGGHVQLNLADHIDPALLAGEVVAVEAFLSR